MSDNTAIEWTDHTFNPWWGCARVSPACRFCYADTLAKRYGHEVWRRHGPRRILSEANWARPIKWNRDAERTGQPLKVFCASMADVFEAHPQVVEARIRLWRLIEETPWLIWQLLTKRPENIAEMAPWGDAWPANVWIGTSVENQRYAEERIPHILRIPATIFLSCEPLIGDVDLTRIARPSAKQPDLVWDVLGRRYGVPGRLQAGLTRGVDWVIAGGESGQKARPSHPGWFQSLRDQCVSAGVPFFFKQHGEWAPHRKPEWPADDVWRNPKRHCWVSSDNGKTKPFDAFNGIDFDGWAHVSRVGKKEAGRLLDGREWSEFPSTTAGAA